MADRKISDLTALTTPASGDYLPIVDISEVAAASKNKRITIEELMRGAPNGTAAAPSIAFEGDPNTGIYRPGADQLAISTNGIGKLFVDSAGNVDFTSAGLKITTGRNISATAANSSVNIFGSDVTTNAGANIELYGGSHATFANLMILDAGEHRFRSADGSSERARIDSSGRLLVGTSSDSGGALLQVNGNRIRIATANTPASAGATGTTGEIAWDANYIYVAVGTNTWKRAALSSW